MELPPSAVAFLIWHSSFLPNDVRFLLTPHRPFRPAAPPPVPALALAPAIPILPGHSLGHGGVTGHRRDRSTCAPCSPSRRPRNHRLQRPHDDTLSSIPRLSSTRSGDGGGCTRSVPRSAASSSSS